MKKITLKANSDIDKRINFLTKLYDNAETRILHSDTFRQKNMNYGLVIFAGLFALGLKTNGIFLHLIISAALIILMLLITIWDRRWHKTKHGWQESRDEFRNHLVDLINNPDEDIEIFPYYAEGEDKAEYFSWQPVLFYLLVFGSIASFFIFELFERYVPK